MACKKCEERRRAIRAKVSDLAKSIKATVGKSDNPQAERKDTNHGK